MAGKRDSNSAPKTSHFSVKFPVLHMRMLCFEKQDEARPIAWVHPQFSSEFFVQEKNREDAHLGSDASVTGRWPEGAEHGPRGSVQLKHPGYFIFMQKIII